MVSFSSALAKLAFWVLRMGPLFCRAKPNVPFVRVFIFCLYRVVLTSIALVY